MVTRDPDASFDTPNVVIGRQDRNELTLSFRPDPYLDYVYTRSSTIDSYSYYRYIPHASSKTTIAW